MSASRPFLFSWQQVFVPVLRLPTPLSTSSPSMTYDGGIEPLQTTTPNNRHMMTTTTDESLYPSYSQHTLNLDTNGTPGTSTLAVEVIVLPSYIEPLITDRPCHDDRIQRTQHQSPHISVRHQVHTRYIIIAMT